MRIPSFIKINNYNRFEFTPRYYDERKERIEQLEEKYGHKDSPEATRIRLKGSFKKGQKRSSNKSTTIRLLLIVAGLSYLAWSFLYSGELVDSDSLFNYF